MKKTVLALLVLSSIYVLFFHQSEPSQDSHQGLNNVSVFPTDKDTNRKVNFVPDAIYGNTEEITLDFLGSIAVDHLGRVFIADRMVGKIHVYDSKGNYQESLGRKGNGPEEYLNIGRLRIIDNNLYAYDPLQMRLNIYSLPSNAYKQSVNLNRHLQQREVLQTERPGDLIVIDDGKILARFSPRFFTNPDHPGFNIDTELYSDFVFMDFEGEITSDVLFQSRETEWLISSLSQSCCGTNFQFSGKPLLAVSDEGDIYTAWSKEFLIQAYNPEGLYQYGIHYPYKPPQLDRETAMGSAEIETRKRMIQYADLPDTWPALQSMVVDDKNQLWVATFTENQNEVLWWILKDTGELIAKFLWPKNRTIEIIKGGYVYSRESDDMGVDSIVRYRIEVIQASETG